jgi:uncharacterized protein
MLCYGATIKPGVAGRKMSRLISIVVGSVLAVAGLSLPAQAQYSDSYNFLKAVKDRDGGKATELLSVRGTTVVNAKDGNGEGALHLIVRARDATWLGFLIGKGARPDMQNRSGDTPLTLAAQIGWAEGADLLLRRGASVNLPNSRGETPLILAVQQRNLPLVRLLLAKGANPKHTDSIAGLSAIDYARQDRRSAAILKMLEAPAAPDKKPAGPGL